MRTTGATGHDGGRGAKERHRLNAGTRRWGRAHARARAHAGACQAESSVKTSRNCAGRATERSCLCVPLVLLRKCWWRAYRWVGRMRMSAWHESQCLAWRLGPGRWGGDRGVRAGCACGLRATHTNHVHEHDGRRRGATQPATSGRVAHIKTQSRMAGPGVRFWRVCNKYVPSASLVTTALTALRRVLRMVLRVNQSAIVAVAHA